jgi:hypothetical protein
LGQLSCITAYGGLSLFEGKFLLFLFLVAYQYFAGNYFNAYNKNYYMKPIPFLLLITLFISFQSNAQIAGAPAAGKLVTGERKGWPSEDRYAFISECITTAKEFLPEHGARYYCYCMQERIEKKYPNVDDVADKIETIMEQPGVKKDAQECVDGKWSSDEREEFLASCIDSAKPNVGEKQAKIYCECMLFKVEKAFPNSGDATRLTADELATPAWKKKVQECNEF